MDLGAALFGDGVDQRRTDIYAGGPLTTLPLLSRLRYNSALLWKTFFAGTDSKVVSRALAASLRPLAMRRLRASLPEAPDMLVAVHFGTAQYVNALAGQFARRPATAVVVTDYQPHWAWFAPADHYVVPSREAEQRALESGLKPEQIVRVDLLPCRLPDAPVPARSGRVRVLAAAGADGSSEGRLVSVLRALDRSAAAKDVEVEAVCGRNGALLGRMKKLAGALENLRLTASGYVGDLPDRLRSADVALLRASPQTVTEAIAAGTPVVAFDWLAHEAGNATLLQHLQCGFASRKPAEAAAMLSRLLEDRAALRELQRSAAAAADRVPGLAFAQRFFAPLAAARLREAA